MNPVAEISSSSPLPKNILSKRKSEENVHQFVKNKIAKINKDRPIEMLREDAFYLGMTTQRLMAIQHLNAKVESGIALEAFGMEQSIEGSTGDERIDYQMQHLQLLMKNKRRKNVVLEFARQIISQLSEEGKEDALLASSSLQIGDLLQQIESELSGSQMEICETAAEEEMSPEDKARALVYNRLGHLLLVAQEEPNKAIQIVLKNSFPQAIKKFAAKSRTYISRVKKSLIAHDMRHKNVSIQNADQALFHKMTVEISKFLVLETGGINFGVIEDIEQLVPERFADTVAMDHLYLVVAELQNNMSLLNQIEDISPPESKNIVSDSAIRAALLLSYDEVITKRHAQIFVLSALLGHLRQGRAGTCFATACLIKSQLAYSSIFVEDLIQLTEQGYIERVVGNELRKFPYLERVTNEYLDTIITLGRKGQILKTQCYNLSSDKSHRWPKPQSGHYLYDSPGIISACTALKLENIKDAVLKAQSWLPKTFSVNCLLKQLAKYAYFSQQNSRILRSEKNRSEEELLTKAQFAFGTQTTHPLHRAYEQAAASMVLIFGSQYAISLCMIELMRDILDQSINKFPESEREIYNEILDESFLPMLTRMRYQYNPHIEDAKVIFDDNNYGTNDHHNFGYELYDSGLPKDFIYSTHLLRMLDADEKDVKVQPFSDYSPPHEWESIGTTEKFQRFLQDVILKTADYLGGGSKYTSRAENLCREFANPEFAKKMISTLSHDLGESQLLKINAHNIRSKPWVFKWGGDFNSVLKTYFGFNSSPSKLKNFNGTPKEVLAKCINFVKNQPDHLKASFCDPRNPVIVTSPVHAFLLRGFEDSFKSAWSSDLSTNEYIQKNVERPGKAIANRRLNKVERDAVIEFVANNQWTCRPREKEDWVRQQLSEKSKEIFDSLIEGVSSPSVQAIANIVCLSRAHDPKIGERNEHWERIFTKIFSNYAETLSAQDPERVKKLIHFARNRKDSIALSEQGSKRFLNSARRIPYGITIKEFRKEILDAAYKAHCDDLQSTDGGWIHQFSPYLDTKIVSTLPDTVQD
ncbi:MAG: hypothetical protein WD595_02255, partial [Waddliaceae bacterium]